MSNDSHDGGDLLGLFLIFAVGTVVGVTLGAGSGEVVPAPPRRARPPLRPELYFRELPGKRRIMMQTEIVQDGTTSERITDYLPPFDPAPWRLRSWFDARRRLHVLDLEPYAPLQHVLDFDLKACWSPQHTYDQQAFRKKAIPVFADDKYQHRLVHPIDEEHGHFLIDVIMHAPRRRHEAVQNSFYHQPVSLSERGLVHPDAQDFPPLFRGMKKIVEIDKQFQQAHSTLMSLGLEEEAQYATESYLRHEYLKHIHALTGHGESQ